MGVLFYPENRRPGQPPRALGILLLGLLITAVPAGAAEKNKTSMDVESIDDLFGSPAPDLAQEPGKAQPSPSEPRLTGFFQNDLAYTYADKKHWSRFNNTLDLATQGRTAGGVAWKLGGRINYDPIYDLADTYPHAVRKDQRFEAMIREAYMDFSAGDWDFRLGRQHVIWGEMVGLFFADVVSAKDMRQLALPDFDIIRIPQWAARAEYFQGDFHVEGVWIPYMSYDNIGKPGAEFYPFNPPAVAGFKTVIASEKQPVGLGDAAYGGRLSYLKDGWDVSGFYYTANDPSAAFSRQIALLPTPVITYQPIHERIHQLGATLGKDLGPMVLKAEAVYTKDKLFSTTGATDADGLVKQNTLDYIVGLEWSFPQETRFNVQFFQRWFPNHNAGIVPDKIESGISLLLSTQALHPRLEPEMLLIRSLNRDDWSAQFKLTWKLDGNWRLATGVDIFGGPPTGLFGAFDNKDRVYTEVRYSF
ncbi:MAG: DUF1302 family protein [Sulfuricella sp.]